MGATALVVHVVVDKAVHTKSPRCCGQIPYKMKSGRKQVWQFSDKTTIITTSDDNNKRSCNYMYVDCVHIYRFSQVRHGDMATIPVQLKLWCLL